MRILAVDDKAMPRSVLERAIRAAEPEAELAVCANAQEVLALPDVAKYHVAFVDVDMPRMNGIELARELKRLNPRINIVFATGFGEFMAEAFALHSSGYLTKPITPEAVAAELANLRHPVNELRPGLYMRCFGDFEVFSNGEALPFARSKSKELLAYLVDRRGAVVSLAEVEAALWEESPRGRTSGSYLRTLVADLRRSLEDAGHADVLVRGYGRLGVDVHAFGCDYYDYLRGDPIALAAWHGEYMSQYSWAEATKASLSEMRT